MLVSGGEVSESFSVTNVGQSNVVYWPPRSSPSSYQQCSTRLSETWGMAATYSSRQSADLFNVAHVQSEDQDYSDTDERAAIRR